MHPEGHVLGLLLSKDLAIIAGNHSPIQVSDALYARQITACHCYPSETYFPDTANQFLKYAVEQMLFPTSVVAPRGWKRDEDLATKLNHIDPAIRQQIEVLCDHMEAFATKFDTLNGQLDVNPLSDFDPFEL